jgi:cytidyltransferase-like protein
MIKRFLVLFFVLLNHPLLALKAEEKIISYEENMLLAKDSLESIVLVGGCFDLLHYGHVDFLQKAKAQGDVLVVALESDENIQRRKQKTPFHTQKQRAYILASLESVDKVILLPSLKTYEDYLQLVKRVKPATLATTSENPYLDKLEQQAKAVNATVKVVNLKIPGLSSTALKKYLTD